MKLYHGTAGENVAGILKRGVKPRRVTGKNNWRHTVASNPHAVYLTSAYGGYFAHQAAKTSLLGIVEVDTRNLDSELFRPDEDFLEQATRETKKLGPSLKRELHGKDMGQRTAWFREHIDEFAHLWEKSLEHMGTCSYLGEIPAEAVTRASIFDYKKNGYIAHLP